MRINKKNISFESVCCYIIAAMIIVSTRSMWIYKEDSIISYEQIIVLSDLFMIVAFFAIPATKKA